MNYELRKLKNFPISFFAVCFGMIGFTLAWQKAEHILQINFKVSNYLLGLTLILIFVIGFIYLMKIILCFDDVKAEFNNPIKINFFPIIAKLFLISSIVFLGLDMTLSKYLWWIGIVFQFGFTIAILSSWITKENYKIHHVNASWFLPVVGCMIVPIAGVSHGFLELSWFFFSIGFFWWLILITIVINRVIFHDPAPDKMVPTLFILFAPPLIGFVSLMKLLGVSPFGGMLYYFGLFMFILISFQLKTFLRIKFYLSWWAYSFPLAILLISTLLIYSLKGILFFKLFAWFIFILLNCLLIMLFTKTIIAIKNKKICIEND